MSKILITGIPGTGKTCIGNFLESERKYRHIDLESTKDPIIINLRGIDLIGLASHLIIQEGDIVVSWGFDWYKEESFNCVKILREGGYKLYRQR